MKKYKLLIIFMMMFVFCGKVYADDGSTCSAANLNELKMMAANVKVSYVPNEIKKETGASGEHGITYETIKVLDVKIFNLTSKLYVQVTSGGNKLTGDEHLVSLKDVASDGAATIRQPAQKEPITYNFKIYSDNYGCSNKVLRSFSLTLPRYNYYSTMETCQDIPEFYLCQEYTTFAIDGTTFFEKVDDYKSKLSDEPKDSEGITSEGSDIVSDTISLVSKNKYIIVGVIVALGVVITIIILKKKRSI